MNQTFNIGFAFGGGYSFEVGTVRDSRGDSKWFYSHGPAVGFALSVGFSEKAIKSGSGTKFRLNDFEGHGSGYSYGLLVAGFDYFGNRLNERFAITDLRVSGDTYNQVSFGVFLGIDLGITWSRTNTTFFNNQ